MTEASSVTTFVMGDRLPWQDDVGTEQVRGPFDRGVIYDGALRRECAIRKISALGATIRGTLDKTAGDEVAVELATGQRPAGTIDWAKAGEIGIRFKQPIDMLALINRQLVSQPTERRAMPRVEIRCSLYVKWCASIVPATLRNISARGLQVEGTDLPGQGTMVTAFIEGLNVPPGEVVWQKGDLAGIELFDELSWTSIIPWIREVGRHDAR